MTYNTGVRPHTGARSRFDPTADGAERLDRILLAACAAIWLAVLGSAVAATVALVDLGRGHPESSTSSGTPWLLYGVIAVSALIIIGAIPLLIRARRAALEDPRAGGAARPMTGRAPTAARAAEPRTQQLRAPQPAAAPTRARSSYSGPMRVSTFDAALPPAVDRLWLRCSVVTACAMGVALLAIGTATYLMAAGHDTAAWAAYVVAGLVTLAMPVVPFFYLRQLHDVLDATAS